MTEYYVPLLGGLELGHFRVAGPGLGNMLLPWARCAIAAKRSNVARLQPTWPQLKLGPIIRGEADWRTYFGDFKKADDEVAGVRRSFILACATRVGENGSRYRSGLAGLTLRTFQGLGAYFKDIVGHETFLYESLLLALASNYIPDGTLRSSVGIHVRCGDFRVLPADAVVPETGVRNAERMPITFYVAALRAVRSVVGKQTEAVVYSDGTREELSLLLQEPHVRRAKAAPAVTDLLAMSQHPLLIGSPHSTFSMWGAFLNRSIFLTFPEAGRDYGTSKCNLAGDPKAWPCHLRDHGIAGAFRS